MKTLYPSIQKISALVMAIAIAGSVNAQKGDYALNSRSTTSYSAQPNVVAGPVIRIMARSANKIVLKWTPFSEGVSHYVLERSADGRRFEEAGLFFTGEWGNEPVYTYTDKLRRAYAGPVFYRLRVVGQDGSELYTTVTIADPLMEN
jgi:hypothetical protein